MKCAKCGRPIEDSENWNALNAEIQHNVCPSEAERSGVLQGCLPSATGSADARAADETGADSSGRSADANGPEAVEIWVCTLTETCGWEGTKSELGYTSRANSSHVIDGVCPRCANATFYICKPKDAPQRSGERVRQPNR
jgi:hypothetical protein